MTHNLSPTPPAASCFQIERQALTRSVRTRNMRFTSLAILFWFSSGAALSQNVATPEQLAPMAEVYRQAWKLSPEPSMRMNIPLHGGILQLSMPRGLIPAFRLEGEGTFMMAFIPDGETWPNYSRAVLVQSSRGLGAAPVETAQLAEDIFKPRSCEHGVLWEPLGQADVGSDSPAFLASTGCASLGGSPSLGQQTFLVLLRGNPDATIVSYAVRSEAFAPESPPIGSQEGRALIGRLDKIILCRSAEQAGCKDIWAMDQIRREALK